MLHAAAARLKKVYPTFVCGQSPVRVRSVQNPHLHLQEICGKSRERCDSVLRGRRTDGRGRLSNTNGFSEEPRASEIAQRRAAQREVAVRMCNGLFGVEAAARPGVSRIYEGGKDFRQSSLRARDLNAWLMLIYLPPSRLDAGTASPPAIQEQTGVENKQIPKPSTSSSHVLENRLLSGVGRPAGLLSTQSRLCCRA